jgi:hypothetical protein
MSSLVLFSRAHSGSVAESAHHCTDAGVSLAGRISGGAALSTHQTHHAMSVRWLFHSESRCVIAVFSRFLCPLFIFLFCLFVCLFVCLYAESLAFALKKGVDIIVGTPGRIKDLLIRDILSLQDILYLVFDEVLACDLTYSHSFMFTARLMKC